MSDVIDGVAEDVDEVGTDVERVEPSPSAPTLFGTSDPAEVIQAASRVATVLTDVLKKQNLTSRISGRDHVQVEGWQTVGSMLGVFPVLEEVVELPWPEPVPQELVNQKASGRKFGFTARYRAQRANGDVVGGAEAECSRTESKWKARDDYALRSMAQTRATSKALKAPLGFVVALAGFATTPADEMPTPEESAYPYGREASADLIASFGRAMGFLFPDNDESRTRLWQELAKDAGGRYMPDISVRSVLRVAALLRDSDAHERANEVFAGPQDEVTIEENPDQESLLDADNDEPGYPD
jgi:hypothetical protein